jgi:hypothetical protein
MTKIGEIVVWACRQNMGDRGPGRFQKLEDIRRN